jgi:hypothetical protein
MGRLFFWEGKRMDVTELRERRLKLEQNIAIAIHTFIRDTGICPESININMMDITEYGKSPARIPGSVEVELRV